jgi:hypothetical protein
MMLLDLYLVCPDQLNVEKVLRISVELFTFHGIETKAKSWLVSLRSGFISFMLTMNVVCG